jgi:hypothetical protein
MTHDMPSAAMGSDIGVAAAVLTLLPQQAQVIVRLSSDARRQVLSGQLRYLVTAGVLSAEEASSIETIVAGGQTDAPAPTGLRPLSVAMVLTSAARDVPKTESIIDDLWVAAVTAWGAIVGEGIGGPVGSVIGATLAHEWAQEHPPSTWFE